MIRSLRFRLTVITMLLLSVVMGMAMYLFFSFTYRGMEEDSLDALHQAGMRYGLHSAHDDDGKGPHPPDASPDEAKPHMDKPDWDKKDKEFDRDKEPRSPIPCFVVGYDHDGQLYAKGPGFYDLTDSDYMEQLLQEAAKTGETSGILWDQQIRFLRLDEVCGEAYALTSVTSELQYLYRLLYQYLLIGLLAMAGFLIVSILTSCWATRPVDQVMKQQRQFVADASHELKTPLTVILTNAELLSSEEYSIAEKDQFTGNILTMAQQMRGLVEELLELARADNGTAKPQMETFDLTDLVSDCVLPFEPVYFEAGKTLESSVGPQIRFMGSKQGLKQVVDILLDNGCKYSLLGSTVTLRLTRVGLKHCLLSVESQGDTLTAQECRDIFKRFYRRDPSRSMNHSYGLGLAIAKTIVRQHRGRIWVKSKNGINTFCVRLPLRRKPSMRYQRSQ